MRFFPCFVFLLPICDPSIVAANERVPLEFGEGVLTLDAPQAVTFQHLQLEGDLHIVSHDRGEVRVQINDFEAELTNYLELDTEANRLRLKLRGDALESDIRIWLPASVGLVIQVMDGDLEIDGMSGGAEVRSHDGRVQIKNARGALLVDSLDGDIEVSLADPSPDMPISLTNHDGGIDLLLPPAFRATLELSTLDGDYAVSLPDEFSVRGPENAAGDKHRRHLDRSVFVINGGGKRVYLNTLDGNVKVRAQPVK